ncbi:TlpA family protein disulfide reductase [Fodinibius sediminis]|uniref:Thiol-disulfide isomerase or thioredoxin n=1 Tax=Fodinibius sediminis TaxID=1214077 RepID=A0A521CM98_9BACT|nr:TlpA disulfide reductase family protein [Fodinibius sediminis]SMO60568.1 Thiol-disulfide isomerase or thioredoxin [Fodinibius sediminis]
MNTENKNKKSSGFKRSLLEWLGIAAVVAILYLTGLHTEVLGTMQRALLWTGLFDANAHEVTTVEGPFLSGDSQQLSLVTPKGEQRTLRDFEGKVLFINVWASWCPPCVAEMPTIETLYEEVGENDNIEFLLISLDEEPEKAVNFMKGKEFSMPYYFPTSGMPQVLQSPYIPSTYVISKKGQVIYKKEGIADYSAPEFRNWLVGISQ